VRSLTPSRILRPLALFALQAALWAALTFAFAALLVLVGSFEWTAALGIAAINWLPWAVLTPIIFLLSRRFPLERGRLLRSVPVHLVAGLACTALCLWISATAFPMRTFGGGPQGFRAFGRGVPGPDGTFVPRPPLTDAERAKRREDYLKRKQNAGPDDRVGRSFGGSEGGFGRGGRGGFGPGGPGGFGPGGPAPAEPSFLNELRRDFFGAFGPFARRGNFGLAIYLIVLSGAHALGYYRRAKQRDVQAVELTANLSRAKLDALRLQLQPHFLFNTLNAIAGLIRERRNDDAIVMIAGLSDLLRRVVDESGRQQVPLGEEVEFLELYLEIQRARFADRLRVTIDVPAELRAAQVPSLILQPLVENAIQHGIGQCVEGGEVRVAATRANGALTIRIGNDGPPLAREWRPGVGVSNSRARLANLYGDVSGLTVQNCAGGVEAVVTMPYTTSPQ
jgi:hypothetical protein